jgi:hypothetical protein
MKTNEEPAASTAAYFKVEGVLWRNRKFSTTPITSDDITVLTAIINIAGYSH